MYVALYRVSNKKKAQEAYSLNFNTDSVWTWYQDMVGITRIWASSYPCVLLPPSFPPICSYFYWISVSQQIANHSFPIIHGLRTNNIFHKSNPDITAIVCCETETMQWLRWHNWMTLKLLWTRVKLWGVFTLSSCSFLSHLLAICRLLFWQKGNPEIAKKWEGGSSMGREWAHVTVALRLPGCVVWITSKWKN